MRDLLVKVKDFFAKDVVIKGRRIPRLVITGLAGVIFLYISTAGAVSVATPWWLGSGDAPRHIDYALSIYHGDIPQFRDRLQYPVFNELADGKYRDQPAAVHPPLFYVLHAPLIGPLMDSGEWQKAIAVGRAFNIFIGVLCIFALAWAGWLFGGRRRALFAVSVPALAVMFRDFTSLNQNYANDVLLILFTTLSLILSYKLIKNGVQKNYVIWLTALSLLGMATKATYLVFLFISLLSLVIAFVIHSKKTSRFDNFMRGGLLATGIFLLVLFTVGWYYFLQNFIYSGSWLSAAPDDYGSGGRPYKSFSEVMTSPLLWNMFYERFSSNSTFSMLMTFLAIGGVASIFDKDRFRKLFANRANLIMVALMIMAVGAILLSQISHAVGYGGYYFRYFLPVMLPLGLFLAYGLLELRWTRAQLVTIFSTGLAIMTMISTTRSSAVKAQIPELASVGGSVERIYVAGVHNGIPELVISLLFASLLAGVVLLAFSLFGLSRSKS